MREPRARETYRSDRRNRARAFMKSERQERLTQKHDGVSVEPRPTWRDVWAYAQRLWRV